MALTAQPLPVAQDAAGKHISELETPALLIDLDRMERNLKRAADYASEHGLRLRPHTKTHKNPVIGKMQLGLGAAGLTVAKVSEAEVMVKSGVEDLLIAYPVVGESKLRRLMAVAGQTSITVGLDSLTVAEALSAAAAADGRTIGVLAEANVGMDRVGLRPGEDLVALGRAISQLPGLRFDGVEFYYGHVNHSLPNWEELLAGLSDQVARIRDDLTAAGIEPRIISGGSSPMLWDSHRIEGMNEIRPGTYVFNDVMQVGMGSAAWDDCAVTIMATVISTARAGFAIIDGGSKTFTSDPARSADATFGRVTEAPESRFYKMNEEHGYIELRGISEMPKIGDRFRIIPNHVCVAVNMHEYVYGIRGEEVEQVWKVEGRGKLQ